MKVQPEEQLQQAPAQQQHSSNVFARAWRGYVRGIMFLVNAVCAGNARLGGFIVRRPVLTLLLATALVVGCSLGFARFKLENDSDVLWVPQKGPARDYQTYVYSYYPRSKQGASFYASLRPSYHSAYGGNNALQIPVTWEMFKLHDMVMALSVPGAEGKALTFADLCYKTRAGGCSRGGYLNFWNYSFSTFLSPAAGVGGSATDPTAGNYAAFTSQVSQLSYPDGNSVSLLSVFGGTTFSFQPSFHLTSAQVIASDYTLDNSVPSSVAKQWHGAFRDLMQAQLPQMTYMTSVFITGSSVGEELAKAINNDMILIIISLVVYVGIAVALLSKADSVATKTTLALLGVFVVCLGILTGWGLGFIFGLPFTSLQQLSPFILVGMGIDVIFILCKGYDIVVQRAPGATLQQAFAQLMAGSGMSVQVTLAASAVAFALGAVAELNSVRWFSAFAALNTVMIMVLMSTMFVAMFVLTERRIKANYRDCCCCPPCARGPSTAVIQVQPHDASASAASRPPSSQAMEKGDPSEAAAAAADGAPPKENAVQHFFRAYYGPFLSKWYVKLVVLLVFFGYAGLSFYAIFHLKYGQPLRDLAPDGSYLVDYDAVTSSTYSQQVGIPTGLYYRSVDFSDPAVQGKMLRGLDMMLSNPYINASTSIFQGNWYITFNTWAATRTALTADGGCTNPLYQRATGELAAVVNPSPAAQQIGGCIPQAQYYPLLSKFLNQSAYAGYKNDIVRAPDGTVLSARFWTMQVAPGSDDKFTAEFSRSMTELEAAINAGLGLGAPEAAFVYNSNSLFNEGDAILPKLAMEYFILALVGVGVVVLLMLVNPWTALLLMCAVGLVDLYLFGELWMVGVKFNQVSVINMIMATGLAVDYSVYFTQKFMTVAADNTLNGRMQLALADTGSAVFLGGFTAMCGTVPMAFAKSIIIRTFFRLIFGTIVFSLAIGLILLPVVLSLVGPPPVHVAMVPAASSAAGEPSEPAREDSGTSDKVVDKTAGMV